MSNSVSEYFSKSKWVEKLTSKIEPALNYIFEEYNIVPTTIIAVPTIIFFFVILYPSIRSHRLDKRSKVYLVYLIIFTILIVFAQLRFMK